MNIVNKAITLLFWLSVLVTTVIKFEGVLAWLPLVGLIVLILHLLEAALFWISFKQHSRQPKTDALSILVFGIFHFKRFIRSS